MEKLYIGRSEDPATGFVGNIQYHIKTLYLITKSDLKTTVLPAAAFALTAGSSSPLLTTPSSIIPDTSLAGGVSFLTVLQRLPVAILWIWLNLFLFNLANQRLPGSIIEDSINKPWRAIPSGRLSPSSATTLLLCSIPLVFLSTLYLGGTFLHVFLLVLTWMYNDLGGGDSHFLIRHLLNALGFVTFGAGAAVVAAQSQLNNIAYSWLGFIAAVITCTIQFQDMEDQEGDRMRERKTLPIILGDTITRRINTVVILVFSALAPMFWNLTVFGYVLPLGFGATIAIRSMTLKTLKQDKSTFKLWCLWLVMIYLLPLLKTNEQILGTWMPT